MLKVAPALIFSSALLLSMPAAAQENSRQGQADEIVVTGTRDVEKQVSDFVGALTGKGSQRQLARFETEVCPAVVGLGATHKAAIEARLKVVAKAAGIPVAGPGCEPNAFVMIVGAKGAFIEALYSKKPDYFGGQTSTQVRRLMKAPGRSVAWQLQGKVNARGVAMTDDSSLGVPINRTTEDASRITAAARPVFEAAAVVVEQAALAGLTTVQLADYAAMRLFAQTAPERLADSTAPTIATIIDAPPGSAVPLTLTEWDLSFLRGLYSTPKNLLAGAQRAHMGREIAKKVVGEDAEANAKDAVSASPRR